MKPIPNFTALVLITGIIIFVSCKKEKSCEGCTDKNKPPIAIAGPDRIITLPTDSVSLDGSNSSDPDGSISIYLWIKISGPASLLINNSSAAVSVAKNLTAGVYQFELKVTDNGGLTAKDTMQVIVDPVLTLNHAPIANAGPDQTITLPTNTVNLDGSASTDPDNNITSYVWAKISGPSSFNISNTNIVQTQVTNLVQGVYQFELKVTDIGNLSAKDTVQVTVNPVLPPPPSNCDIANRPRTNADLIFSIQLPEPRYRVTFATTGNKIFIAGGFTSFSGTQPANFSSRVDIYNITNGQWTTTQLSEPRIVDEAVELGNKIFFAGGWNTIGLKTTIDIHDVSANTWNMTQLSQARDGIAGGAVDNKVVFAGGVDIPNLFSIVDIYDAAANSMSTASLSEARYGGSVTTVGQKIFFAGGQNCWIQDCPTNRIDIYDASTNTWSYENYMPQNGGYFFAGITAGNKNYWVTGDYWRGGTLVEIRDETTHSISYECLSGTLYGNPVKNGNKIIFPVSSFPADTLGYSLTHFDVYDLSTNTWSIKSLPQPGVDLRSFISVNNEVYAFGGSSNINDFIYDKLYKLQF